MEKAKAKKVCVATVLVVIAGVSSFVAIRVLMIQSNQDSNGDTSTRSSESDSFALADARQQVPEFTPVEPVGASTSATFTASTGLNLPSTQTETNRFEVNDSAPETSAAQTNNPRSAANPCPTNLIALVWISPGAFVMGSPEGERGRRSNEGPQTRVTISYGYWLGKYEVTVGQYSASGGQGMQNSPSTIFREDDLNVPVSGISWEDSTDFCRRLTEREHQAGQLPEGYVYRLPTDAEWEYACRAGTISRFSFGNDEDYSQLDRFAWFRSNSGNSIQPVGTKMPNPFGLYDMHGNAHEWVLDFLKYTGADTTNPVGLLSGRFRASRGGGWESSPEACRSAFRHSVLDSRRIHGYGFRIALAPPLSPK